MNKVKVLAVAPYAGMKDMIESVAAVHDDIEVTTVVGNMDRGVSLVRKCDQSAYDVILSRGGTAELVKEIASIPVIEIELTPYDICNALATASGANRKLAVVGFPGIAEAAGTLCDILNLAVEIVTIHDSTEAQSVLPRLKQEGVELLLCDTIGMETAPALGMEAVLITSGVKGVEDALNKAASYFSSFGRVKLASAIQEAELNAAGERLVVLSSTGHLVYASPEPTVLPAMRKLLCRMIPLVLNDGSLQTSRPVGNKEYAVAARAISYNSEPCVAFRIRSEGTRLPVSTPGVRFYDSSERDMTRIFRHYGSRGSDLVDRAEKIARSGLPALVCGEKGTLTGAMAGYICMQGRLSERDCCVVDCAAVSGKGWAKLLGQSGLLSFRAGTTVLFDNLLDMPDREIENLIDFILAAGLTQQLHMVFAVTTGVYPNREEAVGKLITDRLYGVVLKLLPLRERRKDLPEIIANCFTYICADLGVRMPTVEPEGMELLLDYPWPRNYPQLYRVLTQLITSCGGTELGAEQIGEQLRYEKTKVSIHPDTSNNLNLSGTLEDISYRVVLQVLAEEGMNRSRTARRLGISRATLWRILGREQD